jgi:SPX domain protein involved in polyphosphate accumulation
MATEFRHEYKYICSASQLTVQEKRLERLLSPDKHAGARGTYLIRSVYFDTPDNACYYENEDGVDPRSKYRIRIYNCSDKRITLERKVKCRGMTHKDSGRLSREMCEMMLRGKIPDVTDDMSPALAYMLTDMKLEAMRPAVIVQYERRAFTHSSGNVRVTLDFRISSSQSFDRFFDPEMPARQILANGSGVLEVKWDQFIPSYIKDQLQTEGLQWTSFSKYYLCRKYNNHGGALI